MKAIETRYNGYRFRSRLEARWAVFFDTLEIPYKYEPEGFDLDGTWYLPDFYLPKQRYYLEIKGELPSWDDKVWSKVDKLSEAGERETRRPFNVFLLWGDVEHPPKDHLLRDYSREMPPKPLSSTGIAKRMVEGLFLFQHCWIECPFCSDYHIIAHGSLLSGETGWCSQHPLTIEVLDYLFRERRVDQILKHLLQKQGESILDPYYGQHGSLWDIYGILSDVVPEKGAVGFPYYKPDDSEVWSSMYIPPSKRLKAAYAAARAARFEHGESG